MKLELLKELLDNSGIVWATYDKCYQAELGDIEHFAEEVRKDYLEEMNGHTLKMVMLAIAREREACAILVLGRWFEGLSYQGCVDAIRARSINSVCSGTNFPIINEQR
jgi:hypothetical protein